MKKILLVLLFPFVAFSQDDLLKDIEVVDSNQVVTSAF